VKAKGPAMTDDEYLRMDSVTWMSDQNTLVLRNSDQNRYRMMPVGQDIGEELLVEAYDAVVEGGQDEYADLAKHSLEYTDTDVGGTRIDYKEIDIGLDDTEVLDTRLEMDGEEVETRAATGVFYALLGGGDIKVHRDLTAEEDALQYVADVRWDWVRAQDRDLDSEFTDVEALGYEAAATEIDEAYDELVFDGFESEEVQQQGLQAMMGGGGPQEVTWTKLADPESHKDYRMQTIPEAGEMVWKEYQKTEGREGAFSDRALESINTYTPISLPVEMLEDNDVETKLYSTVINQQGTIQPHGMTIELEKDGEEPVAFEAPAGLLPHYVPTIEDSLNAREMTTQEMQELQSQQNQMVIQGGQRDGGQQAQTADPDLDYIQ